MSEVSEMLQRIRELSEQQAVEIQKQDPEYSGLNYSRDPGTTSIDLSSIFNNTSASNVQPYTWNTLSPSSVGGLTVSAGTGLNYQSPYTFNGTTPNWSIGENKINSTIDLKGENADIRINGVSLVDTLKIIQDRLNILTPNPKMEEEWDQLRELGKQYRELEKKLTEQGDMWAKLKAMPPPVID